MDFKEFKSKFQKVAVVEYPNQVKEKPVVSVCLQTYQHVDYIRDCLEGVIMQQTDFPFEILLGEDGSKDGTREICLEYAGKHPDKIRLFLHHRENNISVNDHPTGRFNFIYNLFSAQASYIALCDGDDYWTDPLKLQKQVEFLNNNRDVRICFTGNSYLSVNNQLNERNTGSIISRGSFRNLLDENYMVNSTVVFKNSIFRDGLPLFLTEIFVGDWPLFLWLLKDGKYISFLNFNSVVHRRGVGVFRHYKYQTELVLKSTLTMKSKFQRNILRKDYIREIKKSKKKDYLNLMAYHIKRKRLATSLVYFYKASTPKTVIKTLKFFGYSFKLGMVEKY